MCVMEEQGWGDCGGRRVCAIRIPWSVSGREKSLSLYLDETQGLQSGCIWVYIYFHWWPFGEKWPIGKKINGSLKR